MPNKHGFTIMELIIILIIIGVAVAFCLPNFTGPTEQARALTAQNNLLAIYSAEQNYNNNKAGNNNYCINTSIPTPCDNSISDINTALSLNIQDDGSYTYICSIPAAGVFMCSATRTNPNQAIILKVILNQPININGANANYATNPVCIALSGTYTNWCPV